MPPFQYDSYRNPYAGTIGDLILRRGEIAARQAEQVAAAQARATEVSGSAWAGAAGTIAQTVAALPQQIQQQKRQALADQVRDIQLRAAKRDEQSHTVFEAVLKNPSNYHPDGTVDDDKVTAELRIKDVGAWQQWSTISAANRKNALDTSKAVAELQKTNLEIAEKQRAAVAVRDTYLGKLAFHGEQLLNEKSDDPLHARDTVLATVARAAADGMISEPQARAFLQQTAGAAPDQLRQMFAAFVPPDVRETLDKELAATAKTKADAAKASAEATNLTRFGRPTRPNFEQKNVTLDGRPNQLVNYDPATGQNFLPGSTDPIASSRIAGNTPPSVVIHNEKDRQDAPNRTNNAEQLVAGNMPPSMLSKRGADYNATLAEANRLSVARTGKPINIGKLQLDYEGAKKFVAGMNSTQMIRYRGLSESVVNTIDEVQRLADLLQQGSVQKWNSVTRNTIRQVYGNTPASELANQYIGAVNTLKEEFANLANGGYAPTEAAWKLANDQINGDFGFKDLRASLTEVQRLINYRTAAFNDQRPYTPSATPSGNEGAPPPAVKPTHRYNPATGKVEPIQ